MQFTYTNGIPTIEQAVKQALGRWANPAGNPLVANRLLEVVEREAAALISEITTIQTAELSTLMDPEGVAMDFNQGVEMSIRCIEGSL